MNGTFVILLIVALGGLVLAAVEWFLSHKKSKGHQAASRISQTGQAHLSRTPALLLVLAAYIAMVRTTSTQWPVSHGEASDLQPPSGDSLVLSDSTQTAEAVASASPSEIAELTDASRRRNRHLYADRSKEILPPVGAADYSKEVLPPIGEKTALDDYPLSNGLHTDLGPIQNAPDPNNTSGPVQSPEHP